MASNQTRIIQTGDPADYARRFNGATFDDYDATLFDHTNIVEKELWADANDFLYIGKDTAFAFIGFMVGTPQVGYGAFTIEYWNGAWVTLTVLHNDTEAFTESGFLAWSIPGDWATTTIDTQSAFWIRASQSAVAPATPATALNLLLNLTLDAPIVHDNIMPVESQTTSRDTAGTVRKNDLVTAGVRNLPIDCTYNTMDWAGMFLLNYWLEYKRRLFIDDLARTTPVSISGDSYWQNFAGLLVFIDGKATAFQKQDTQSFQIMFKVDSGQSIPHILGMDPP